MTTNSRVQQLETQYPDAAWRLRFIEILDLLPFLRHCIIDSKYRVSDAMNQSIKLSDYGASIQRKLNARESAVNPKDARLACFLEIAHDQLMFDVEKTDIDALRDEISRQIQEGLIKFPLVFGRELYDRAADIFPDLRTRLNAQETRRLLEGVPTGVFQIGTLVSGPYGLLRSLESRLFTPTARIPLQHCPEMSCHAVHETWLSTDHEAPINQALPRLSGILEPNEEASQAWSEFAREIAPGDDGPNYDDRDLAALPIVLGDCLTIPELRSLVFWLHEGVDDHRLRDVYRKVGIGNDLESSLNATNLGELLQLCWVATDEQICTALDALVREGRIKIPTSEVRRARINGAHAGAFHVGIEIGSSGVRTVAQQRDVPLLRLHRLVSHLYDISDTESATDLWWLLRGTGGPTVDARLANYLRVTPPREVLRTLVLWRRNHVETAAVHLRLDAEDLRDPEDPTGTHDLDDDSLVSKMLWKLGFPQANIQSATTRLWSRHRDLMQQIRALNPNQPQSADATNAAAQELFRELEGFLRDCIEFTTWSLTSDHPSNQMPFVYKDVLGSRARTELHDWWKAQANAEKLTLKGDTPSLYPLTRGFQVIAQHLRHLLATKEDHRRTTAQLPRYAGKTDLRQFPFGSTSLFLDLLPDSQRAILDGLDSVTEFFVRADVTSVRNDVSHYRQTPIDVDRLTNAAEATRRAVERLEALGFSRTLFWREGDQRDRWGRVTYHLRSDDGGDFALLRPSPFQWVGFPHLDEPQYLMRAAKFAEPNEILRFSLTEESDFGAMWTNFPRRRRGNESEFHANLETAIDVARSTHRVLPQTR